MSRNNSPPVKARGFLWNGRRQLTINSFPDLTDVDWAVLWWEEDGKDTYNFRIPIRHVASLTDDQMELYSLREGFLVEVIFVPGKKKDDAGVWQVTSVNGLSLQEHFSSSDVPWRDRRAYIDGFLPHREPRSRDEALFWFLFPILVGTNVVIAGAAGTEKTALARWLIKSIIGYKVLLQVGERPQEAEFYTPDEETEIWRFPSDMEADDVSDLLTWARLTIEARAARKNGMVVMVDSLAGVTNSKNMGVAIDASSRPAQPGGIDPMVQKVQREFLGMARYTEDGHHITLLNLWPLTEGMMAAMADHLKAWANSLLLLDPHSKDAIAPFQWILNRRLPRGVSPTHRAVEFAEWVEVDDVRYLWALYNTELPSGEAVPQNGRNMNNQSVRPSSNRLGRSQWEKLADHVFESWQRDRPQSCKSPRAIAGLLVRLWREWPLVVGYDGSLDVFPKEIREEVEGMLRRRVEDESRDEEAEEAESGSSPFNRASPPDAKGRKGARDRRNAQQAAAGQPHNGAIPVVTQTSSRWVPDQPLKPGQFIAPAVAASGDGSAIETADQNLSDPYELPPIDDEAVKRLAERFAIGDDEATAALQRAAVKWATANGNVTEGKDG